MTFIRSFGCSLCGGFFAGEKKIDSLIIMENLHKMFGFSKNLIKGVKEEVKGELFEDFEIREQLQNGMDIINSPNFFQTSVREEVLENIFDQETSEINLFFFYIA